MEIIRWQAAQSAVAAKSESTKTGYVGAGDAVALVALQGFSAADNNEQTSTLHQQPLLQIISNGTIITTLKINQLRSSVMAMRKRRSWEPGDIRVMRAMARKKTPARRIARKLRRTEGATRQKAFSIGLSLESRA
jgi:hypothetical protein